MVVLTKKAKLLKQLVSHLQCLKRANKCNHILYLTDSKITTCKLAQMFRSITSTHLVKLVPLLENMSPSTKIKLAIWLSKNYNEKIYLRRFYPQMKQHCNFPVLVLISGMDLMRCKINEAYTILINILQHPQASQYISCFCSLFGWFLSLLICNLSITQNFYELQVFRHSLIMILDFAGTYNIQTQTLYSQNTSIEPFFYLGETIRILRQLDVAVTKNRLTCTCCTFNVSDEAKVIVTRLKYMCIDSNGMQIPKYYYGAIKIYFESLSDVLQMICVMTFDFQQLLIEKINWINKQINLLEENNIFYPAIKFKLAKN